MNIKKADDNIKKENRITKNLKIDSVTCLRGDGKEGCYTSLLWRFTSFVTSSQFSTSSTISNIRFYRLWGKSNLWTRNPWSKYLAHWDRLIPVPPGITKAKRFRKKAMVHRYMDNLTSIHKIVQNIHQSKPLYRNKDKDPKTLFSRLCYME